MSECEKGSFWEVSVPKTSAAAIFSGDLYIFAKYAPVFSNSAFPTTSASHRHCHVRTYVQMRSFNFCSFSLGKMSTDREHWQVRERYYPTPPHPTPPLRDVTHLQRSMTYVRTCKWTCRGVTSWERASTWTLLPTPPHPCVTWHIFNVAWRMCAIVRTCKWTCRGVTSWECASTWTLLPHPTPPLRDVTHLQRSMTYLRNCAHVQVNVPWRNIMGVRKYVNVITPPHPTPPRPTPPHPCVTWHIFNVAWRICAIVRTCKWTCRGVTSWECASTWTLLPTTPHPCVTWHIFNVAWRMCAIVRTCKWTCRGVTSWECASTWTLLPTPPHPCVTWHIFNVAWRICAIVRTCKWTCRGVTSWECASTWTLLPHPTPPHPAPPHPTPAWRDTSST